MIVCWEGLFATAIEEGDSTAPVSDKPTIRELAAGPERTGGVRGNLSGIAGDNVGSRHGQGEKISGPSVGHFSLTCGLIGSLITPPYRRPADSWEARRHE